MLIRAVLFDLDDTLYEQRQWLRGAWRAVANAGVDHGIEPGALEAALVSICAEGSDRGRIIDRALARIGAPQAPVCPLVEAFRSYAAARLTPYPGVRETLARLRREFALGLVTDGDVAIQRAKLRALGISEAFDVIVLSDALGRDKRKPHPAPFMAALRALEVEAEEAVYIGDRPDKDTAGAAAAGLRAIRVLTGEYAAVPDGPPPWARARNVSEAAALIS